MPVALAYVNMLDMSRREDLPLGYLLQRAMGLLRPQVTAELRPLGLGLPQFVCMRILATSPGRSSAALARVTNVTPQAMDQMLSGLQDAGVVARPEVVSSGRARPAKLTAKGRALLKRAEAAVRVADERILIDLTPIEQRQLKRLLYALGSQTADRAAALCTPSDVEGDAT
jgi:DNA-binding MarR family transcriptional regulator